ncbi:hypothetical protein ACHAWF_007947 [Thalassiosira exigua]
MSSVSVTQIDTHLHHACIPDGAASWARTAVGFVVIISGPVILSAECLWARLGQQWLLRWSVVGVGRECRRSLVLVLVHNDGMNTPPAAAACGSEAADATATASKPEPVNIAFTVGNTYKRLSPSDASYDRLTGRHLKIHDWCLYVDVLPGQDPDIIDRVTFDMRDDSFVTSGFTCHCPIRIRSNVGSKFIGKISGGDNKNISQGQVGQSTKEEEKTNASASMRPHPNQSRWRFSTRQQTYGPVDVQVTIRGRGGCRCTVPYRIVLNEGGYECPAGSLPLFTEKRPHQQLKPLKMMDASVFSLKMYFGLDLSIGASFSLRDIANSVYSRSKLPIQLLLENGQTEVFAKKPSAASASWLMNVSPSATRTPTIPIAVASISSPDLKGGHGLNECYKLLSGLPPSCIISNASMSFHITVQMDVTMLSLQQIVKVCQNFIKYEEAIDSFAPWYRREYQCEDCRSNKQAMEGDTNKQRNQNVSRCGSLEELVACLNPVQNQQYKLNLRKLVNHGHPGDPVTKRVVEFRQHTSSKDKTTVTHWIRFCSAFITNSARLRAPMALKGTTSIEEEFDLLFEYVVKDRALRNFYKEKRDTLVAEEEKGGNQRLMVTQSPLDSKLHESMDSMSFSDSSDCGGSAQQLSHVRQRTDSSPSQSEPRKRACL